MLICWAPDSHCRFLKPEMTRLFLAVLVPFVTVEREQAIVLNWHKYECDLPLQGKITVIIVEMKKKAFPLFHKIKKKILHRLTLSRAQLRIRILLSDKKYHKTPVLGNKSQQHLLYIRTQSIFITI